MTTGELLLRFALAFAITQLVECPIYSRVFRLQPSTAFVASLITHPLVTLVIPPAFQAVATAVSPASRLSPLAHDIGCGLLAELFAVAVESLWIRKRERVPARRAWLASITANVSSSCAGGLVYLATGWP